MLEHLYNYIYGTPIDHNKYFFDPKDYKWDKTKIYKEICQCFELKLVRHNLYAIKRLINKEIQNNNDFIDIKKKLNQDYIDEIVYNSKLSDYSNFIKDAIDKEANKIKDWVIITDYAKDLNKGNKIKFKSRNNTYFYLLKKN